MTKFISQFYFPVYLSVCAFFNSYICNLIFARCTHTQHSTNSHLVIAFSSLVITLWMFLLSCVHSSPLILSFFTFVFAFGRSSTNSANFCSTNHDFSLCFSAHCVCVCAVSRKVVSVLKIVNKSSSLSVVMQANAVYILLAFLRRWPLE